jgi:AraC family transcriptional activator of pobA
MVTGLLMIPTYSIGEVTGLIPANPDFLIRRFEDIKTPEDLIWPHKHNFYELLWVQAGQTTHVIDYHKTVVESDTLFFMSPGQVHLVEDYRVVKGDCVLFTEEFFLFNLQNKNALLELSFLDEGYSTPRLHLSTEAARQLLPVLQLFYEEQAQTEPVVDNLRALLLVLLSRIQRLYTAQTPPDNSTPNTYRVLVKQFKRLLEAQYKANRSVSAYASAMAVTPHHLNEAVKKVTSKTAGEVIRERGLLEAKRLLIHSHYAVGQISDELGFADFSYFSRQFRQATGLSPLDFRNQMYEKHQNTPHSG